VVVAVDGVVSDIDDRQRNDWFHYLAVMVTVFFYFQIHFLFCCGLDLFFLESTSPTSSSKKFTSLVNTRSIDVVVG
jgi:hypothetical protein